MLMWYVISTRKLIQTSSVRPDTGKDGATLLTQLINSNLFDIASDLLRKLPKLAITDDNDGRNVVSVLAKKPSAFPSGRRNELWQQYKSIHLGIEIRKTKSEMHALEVLEIVSTQVSQMEVKQLKEAGIFQAVLDATKFGIVEFVYKLMTYNRHMENCKDKDGKSTFLYAIMYRQEKVFNLIQDMRNKKTPFSYIGKEDGNNTLHQAALLNSFSRIERISGVHLQMQRELHWFQEVEKLVPPKFKDELNHQGDLVATLTESLIGLKLAFDPEGEQFHAVHPSTDPTKKAYLNWDLRYKIIERIARGMLYLREDSFEAKLFIMTSKPEMYFIGWGDECQNCRLQTGEALWS
ncbi:Ankyrin repeat family protein [Thalictrum thalictroides]|uniref:Ankyrin repeat family protein n=1 Tax=Thalictrum thalictroides TaxID=46969 RepID=A0A7J6WPH0_THATH|nr:Ankyrin repeat family protein [Thalictrum thalictroides]